MKSFPRWFTAGIIAAALVLLAAGIWLFIYQGRNAENSVHQDLEAIAQLKVDEIVNWRQDQLREAREMMERPTFSEVVERWMSDRQSGDTDLILGNFQALKNHYGYFDILLVDPDGYIQLSLDGRTSILQTDARGPLSDSFDERSPVLTDLHPGSEDQPIHIDVIAPIFRNHSSTGLPICAVIMQLDAEQYLYPLLSSWPMPSQSAETLLVRKDGDSVLFLNNLRFRSDSALSLRIPMTQEDLPSVMAVQGKTGLVQGKDYRGVDVLSIVKPIPDSPWFMVSKIDTREVYSNWRFEAIIIIALIGGTFLFLGVTGFIAWQNNQKKFYKDLYESEAARQTSEGRFLTTLMSIGDGVIVTDKQGRIVLMNPVAEALTGWLLPDSLNRPLAEILHTINPITAEPETDTVGQLLDSGKIDGIPKQTILVSRTGTEFFINRSIAQVRDSNGILQGAVIVFGDMTERHRIVEALRRNETSLSNTQKLTKTGGWEWNIKTQTNFWTEETYRIHGYKPGDIDPGLPVHVANSLECYNPQDRQIVLEAFNKCCEDGVPYDLEFPFTDINGNSIWIRTTARAEYEDGNIVKVVGSIADITEQKLASDALAESQRQIEFILGATKTGLDIIDADFNLRYVDPEWAKIYGDWPGRKCYDYFMDRNDPCPGCGLPETFRLKQVSITEEILVRENDRAIQVTSIPYQDSDGEWLCAEVNADITDRKNAEKERITLIEELEAKNTELERFTYTASHDLKSPVITVKGYLGMIRDDIEAKNCEQTLADLSRIEHAADKMMLLLDDLLELSRIGRVVNPPVTVSMTEIAKAAVEQTLGDINKHGVTVIVADNMPVVEGDKQRLTEVMQNLIENAIKFMAKQPDPLIEIGCALENGEAVCYVRDNGMGIEPRFHEKIFGIFDKLNPDISGTGVGLAIVKRVIEMHRGRIWVESEGPGKGSTFKFTLPVKKRGAG